MSTTDQSQVVDSGGDDGSLDGNTERENTSTGSSHGEVTVAATATAPSRPLGSSHSANGTSDTTMATTVNIGSGTVDLVASESARSDVESTSENAVPKSTAVEDDSATTTNDTDSIRQMEELVFELNDDVTVPPEGFLEDNEGSTRDTQGSSSRTIDFKKEKASDQSDLVMEMIMTTALSTADCTNSAADTTTADTGSGAATENVSARGTDDCTVAATRILGPLSPLPLPLPTNSLSKPTDSIAWLGSRAHRQAQSRQFLSQTSTPVGAIRVEHYSSSSMVAAGGATTSSTQGGGSSSIRPTPRSILSSSRHEEGTSVDSSLATHGNFESSVLSNMSHDNDATNSTIAASQTNVNDADSQAEPHSSDSPSVPLVAYLADSETPRQNQDTASREVTDSVEQSSKGSNRPTSRRQRLCTRTATIVGILIVLVGLVVGGTCGGTGQCSRSNKTRQPDTTKRRVIYTTMELYQAVDAYILERSNTNGASFNNSSVSLSPSSPSSPMIGSWDVSRISDFSRLFDPNRISNSWDEMPVASTNSTSWTNATSNVSSWSSTNGTATTNAASVAMATFNEDLTGWDMSSATTLHGMFASASAFNGNISTWNVSSVVNMSHLFYGAAQFAGDISQWNVGRVQDMQHMMDGAHRFSSDVSLWNVSAVTDLSFMFHRAYTFDSDLSQWDVSRVLTMESMFNFAIIFASDLALWNVSRVKTTRDMFADAGQFSSDLTAWNLSSALDISRMFLRASSMQQRLCDWRLSLSVDVVSDDVFLESGCPETSELSISDGPYCFACEAFAPFETTEELYAAVDMYLAAVNKPQSAVSLKYGYPIGAWDVSRLSDFSRVFDPQRDQEFRAEREPLGLNAIGGFSTFNEDLADWDTSSATTMFGMFAFASKFNGNVSAWNTSSVLDMSDLFNGANEFSKDLSAWDVGRVESMARIFRNCHDFNSNLSAWNVARVRDMRHSFHVAWAFAGDIAAWNVSRVQDMHGMFHSAQNFSSELRSWDVSRVTDLGSMFEEARNFQSDLSMWNVSRVQAMAEMFRSASRFQSQLDEWDVGLSESMEHMFSHLKSFTSDLSRWNVGKVKNMEEMFNEATLFSSDLSEWDVGAVYSMKSMFAVATSFESDISTWNVSNVRTTEEMFNGAVKFNSDLSRWDVRKVDRMARMFTNALRYNHSLCAWATRLPLTANVEGAFVTTRCPDTSDPVLPIGPFCVSCASSSNITQR